MTKKTSEQKREEARLRKQRQRQRARESGVLELTVSLSPDEKVKLDESMRIRGGNHQYSQSEYLQLLVIRDHQRLQKQIEDLGTCPKCGKGFNESCGTLFYGDSACLMTRAQIELKL